MDIAEIKKILKEHYLGRDVTGIVQYVSKLKASKEFPTLHRNLVSSGLLSDSSGSIEQIATALIGSTKREIEKSGSLDISATYFEIGEQLKRKFGDEVADCYVQTKMPDDFMLKIRQESEHGDTHKLSDHLVEQYKSRLIGIEKSRRSIVDIIQPFSVMPIQHLLQFDEGFKALALELKSNYKYLIVKPYLDDVRDIAAPAGDESEHEDDEEANEFSGTMFSHYLITGREPELVTLVEFNLAITKLFQVIKRDKMLEPTALAKYWSLATQLWHSENGKGLSPKARKIFIDLLETLIKDKTLLKNQLATTFMEEYQCAEEQMKIRHRLIETELANTKEYLGRIHSGQKKPPEDKEEKVRVAIEKLVCLKDVFKTPTIMAQASATKTDAELEQSALDIPTVITPFQLTGWIKIYSIIYSNKAIWTRSQSDFDLSIMREFISDLATYHLTQNIATLKYIIENAPVNEAEKNSQFERFSEALKVRLHSLMDNVKQKERSLTSMIEELSFLNNKSTQFIVADTFKGFQYIVDAFNETSTDFFVNDSEAMLKESRALYDQICNQCLKGLGNRSSIKKSDFKGLKSPKESRSWLRKLFS